MLGFDTTYEKDFEDREITRIGVEENRIILTRDRGILKQNAVTHGHCVRSSVAREQVREVLTRFDIASQIRPFRRCMVCNGMIRRVDKKKIAESLPAKTRQCYGKFYRCSGCGKIYGEGSHYERMKKYVEGREEVRGCWTRERG
jgi:uncharacterized protein